MANHKWYGPGHGPGRHLLLAVTVLVGAAALPAFAKDIGPVHDLCDVQAKGTAAWRNCVAKSSAARRSDAELFYAGYWLAKSGNYREALVYLRQAKEPDDRVLTYLGFASRKLGRTQEAFGYYQAALRKNPDSVVTRSYLGEAYLAIGSLDKAKDELSEIANRCGTVCAPYEELATAVAAYERIRIGNG